MPLFISIPSFQQKLLMFEVQVWLCTDVAFFVGNVTENLQQLTFNLWPLTFVFHGRVSRLINQSVFGEAARIDALSLNRERNALFFLGITFLAHPLCLAKSVDTDIFYVMHPRTGVYIFSPINA